MLSSDYGSSFSDVVRGIQHILENVTTDQHSTPSFKYRIALENQVRIVKCFLQPNFALLESCKKHIDLVIRLFNLFVICFNNMMYLFSNRRSYW